MKDYKHFNGTLEFEGENCQFVFDDFKLIIETPSFKVLDLGFSHNLLPVDNLIGSISTEPNQVYFSFAKNAYSFNITTSGYSVSNIVIYVKFYLVLNRCFTNNRIKIQFNNESFSKWLGVYPKYYNDDGKYYVPNKIEINKDTLALISTFSYKGLTYKAKPGYSLKSSLFHFDFKPTLEIECENMDYQSIYDVCSLFIKVLRFIFYRYYVSLGDICLYAPVVANGKTHYEVLGHFFLQYDEGKIEPIDLGKRLDYGFIRWQDFYSYLHKLVNCIENNNIYLFHLPEKRRGRFGTDLASISTISAAFEYEFSICYPTYKTTKLKDNNYIELKKNLLALQLNDEQKNFFHNIIGCYFDNPSLHEKALFALEQFASVLETLKLDKDVELKKIAKIFKDTRNNIDHGNLQFTIDNDTANTFYYLRIVILCMQLTRLGVSKDKLLEIITPVLSIEYNK